VGLAQWPRDRIARQEQVSAPDIRHLPRTHQVRRPRIYRVHARWLKALAQGAQLTFLAYLIGIAVEEVQEEKSRGTDREPSIRAIDARRRAAAHGAMSIGLGPSALTMGAETLGPVKLGFRCRRGAKPHRVDRVAAAAAAGEQRQ
jgi:hypothetical protein